MGIRKILLASALTMATCFGVEKYENLVHLSQEAFNECVDTQSMLCRMAHGNYRDAQECLNRGSLSLTFKFDGSRPQISCSNTIPITAEMLAEAKRSGNASSK